MNNVATRHAVNRWHHTQRDLYIRSDDSAFVELFDSQQLETPVTRFISEV